MLLAIVHTENKNKWKKFEYNSQYNLFIFYLFPLRKKQIGKNEFLFIYNFFLCLIHQEVINRNNFN